MAKGKRKSNQRKDRNKIESIDNFETDIWSKLFVALGVICFLLVFYLLTVYITNKNTPKNKEEKEETVISNENIILGRALSMSDSDYLVIFYDKGDENISNTYGEMVTNHKYGSDSSRKLYVVDMSSGFNKKYLTTEESNKNPSSVDEFKINGPTLILVSNHTVVDYIEGEEAIRDYLS